MCESPAASLCFSLELNIRVRVKSESSSILSKSLGKSQSGSGKPEIFCDNSRFIHFWTFLSEGCILAPLGGQTIQYLVTKSWYSSSDHLKEALYNFTAYT